MQRVIDKQGDELLIAVSLMKFRSADLIEVGNRQLEPARQNGGFWAKTGADELLP